MSMKPQVFVTRKIPESILTLLRKVCEVEYFPADDHPPPNEFLSHMENKQAILCCSADPIDAAFLSAHSQLKIVATRAVGYDNIDVGTATRYGIAVTNTPGVLTEATADCAFGLLIAIARRIVESDIYVREKRWDRLRIALLLGSDVGGRTLGIIGMGRIGQAVARRALGFGMNVLYHNRSQVKPAIEQSLNATWCELPDLLRQSDFVSLHIPLTADTKHFLGQKELGMMSSNAFLINTARGPVVDEQALIQSLEKGEIAGAALDVFEFEPAVPQELLNMKNVILQPHNGSGSVQTRTRMACMAAENILAVFENAPPPNLLNPEIYTR